MGNRFDARLNRLEALQGEEIDTILSDLSPEQGKAMMVHGIALLQDEEEPNSEDLWRAGLTKARHDAALASLRRRASMSWRSIVEEMMDLTPLSPRSWKKDAGRPEGSLIRMRCSGSR